MSAEIFGPDLLVVLAIAVVVLFGAAAIPRWARGLGSARKEFDRGAGPGPPDDDGPPDGPG
ncbi:MAG TPA: twin-arginine translocase TatA/TatE family subunit [Acidimicrobiales bacterium]